MKELSINTSWNINIFTKILALLSLIVLTLLATGVNSVAAQNEDGCTTVGQSCTQTFGDERRNRTVPGECRRGSDRGILYCDSPGNWRSCADHPNAAGDTCDLGTGTGQCQAVETGSGRQQRTTYECVTSASGGENDAGAGPSEGGENDAGAGPSRGGENDAGAGPSGGDNDGGSPQPQPQSVQFNNPITATLIPELIATIIRGVLGLLGAIAVAIIVYAGFTYMTAGGNASKTAQATTAITNAVIGLVVIMGAFLIVDYVISAIIG